MNKDKMSTDHVEEGQWQGMLRDWRALRWWQ